MRLSVRSLARSLARSLVTLAQRAAIVSSGEREEEEKEEEEEVEAQMSGRASKQVLMFVIHCKQVELAGAGSN